MKQPTFTDTPVLKPGCRLSPASNPESLLLIPEGALRLRGPGRRILELCDGHRTLGEVIQQLQTEFAAPESSRIADEVRNYLAGLQEKGAVEFL